MGKPLISRTEGTILIDSTGKTSKRDGTALHNLVQELLDNGTCYTRKEIHRMLTDAGKIDCPPTSFMLYFRKEQFTVPERFWGSSHGRGGEKSEPIKRRNPIRDEVIAHDPPYLTLEALAQAEAEITGRRITGEGMRQYLVRTGQEETWRERRDAYEPKWRDEKTKLNNAPQRLVDLLLAYFVNRARQESPAAEKAVMYYLKTRNFQSRKVKAAIDLERLLRLCTDYYNAKEEGRVLSLEELGRPYNIHPANVGRILKHMGLEPLNGSYERHPTPAWKKQALRRGKDIDVPTSTIAYLLDIPHYVASQNLTPLRIIEKFI